MSDNAWSVRDKDREGTWRRRELITAARRVFERKGYGAATVSDITSEAGVSRPTFYVYFASKKEVFAVLANEVSEAFRIAQDIQGVDYDDVDAVMRSTIASTFEVTINHLELMSVLDHQALADPEIRALWEPIRRLGIRRSVRYLEAQEARGSLSPAANLDSLAMMGTGMNELFAAQVAGGEIDRDTAIEEMFRIWRVALGRSGRD